MEGFCLCTCENCEEGSTTTPTAIAPTTDTVVDAQIEAELPMDTTPEELPMDTSSEELPPLTSFENSESKAILRTPVNDVSRWLFGFLASGDCRVFGVDTS